MQQLTVNQRVEQFLSMTGTPLDCGWAPGTEATALETARQLAPGKTPRFVSLWQIAVIELTKTQAQKYRKAGLQPLALLGVDGIHHSRNSMAQADAVLATVTRRHADGFIENQQHIYILLGPGRETRTELVVIECLHRAINLLGH